MKVFKTLPFLRSIFLKSYDSSFDVKHFKVFDEIGFEPKGQIRQGTLQPFFDKKMIFDENLWVFKNSLK